ncbi:uncharacterized protein LOC125663429 [Ostrea edulis]|uniref:uncharacterized protein LOC125663429 n=1 Tax=Ostrea edulis TaxID=37623 RepID=UPI0024AF2D92|nr:uncharacterized protein LOC125663429 [Ostrea edulis]
MGRNEWLGPGGMWAVLKLGYVDAQLKESYLNREFLGSLSNELSILFAIERPTFISAAVSCKTQCGGDRRCIGLEICQIQEHLYQCRACCGWKKLGQEMANKNLADCGYFQMVDDNHKRYVNVAVGKPTSMSSTINNYQLPRNAVDGVVLCRLIDLSHSRSEQNPWLKIDLQGLFDILSVLIYARQDCCGTLRKILPCNVSCVSKLITTDELLILII